MESPSPYLTLVIKTFPDLGVAQLAASGPKIPGINESPTIGFYYKNGNYILKIGGGDKVVDPTHLSKELKELLSGGGTNDRKKGDPVSLVMPSKADLKRRDNYMSFAAYNIEVNLRETSWVRGDRTFSKRFPRLPKELYVELVRQYLKEDGFPGWYLYADPTR